MKVAVLGGGITGLVAACQLSLHKHSVVIFEKESALGGLASSFFHTGWSWPLEKTYHHIFSNDQDILDYVKEIGFNKIIYNTPLTSSLYNVQDNYRTFSVDTPQDLLKFPLLGLPDKIRTGIMVLLLKISPFLDYYQETTTTELLKKSMGERSWKIIWEPLMRGKFGKYAGNILASFIWARINKRTKKLAYIKGGFQSLIDFLEVLNKKQGVVVKKNTTVSQVEKSNNNFVIITQAGEGGAFDAVISTLPTPVLANITGKIFPQYYQQQLKNIKYLFASNLIIESETPLFEKEYWINVCDRNLPILALVQHTNFIDKKHYNNKHILYVANYFDKESPLLKMDAQSAAKYFFPHLTRINSKFHIPNSTFYFKAPFAQPIVDRKFIKNKPDFITPVKNFIIANLDITYPYDRGTNFSVKMGKRAAETLIMNK